MLNCRSSHRNKFCHSFLKNEKEIKRKLTTKPKSGRMHHNRDKAKRVLLCLETAYQILKQLLLNHLLNIFKLKLNPGNGQKKGMIQSQTIQSKTKICVKISFKQNVHFKFENPLPTYYKDQTPNVNVQF